MRYQENEVFWDSRFELGPDFVRRIGRAAGISEINTQAALPRWRRVREQSKPLPQPASA